MSPGADLQYQLDLLRQRMASAARRADERFAVVAPARVMLEECVPGNAVENAAGAHYQTGKMYEHFRRYGSLTISELAELPHDFLDGISLGTIPAASPLQWAFLDTETTGLAGGSGTCAFLIGIGRITPEGFRVRQYFLRDFGEEASALDELAADLEGVEALITYNGKSFDLPLLETRYRMARRRPPFTQIPHLDLLHGARRLWRLRMESCSLTYLESQILGLTREGDVPGALIPHIYFDYLRSGSAARLAQVFHHNVLDIVTLAALTAVVAGAFRAEGIVRHPAEMVSLGRWLRSTGQLEQALEMFRRAAAGTLPDDLLFRTLWDTAALEKKLGRGDAALALYADLAGCRNPHRVPALEELAKHYEHRERNWPMALEFTQTALEYEPTEGLRRRQARLLRRRVSK